MELNELFPPGGKGIISTSDAAGNVSSAVYAKPHVAGKNLLAWGMTEGRTQANVKENPRAAYLYLNPGPGYSGIRLTLLLKEFREGGDLLEEIRDNTEAIVGPAAARAVSRVALFEVTEIRSLI